MTEDERRAIVEGEAVYLHDGLRVTLGGIMNPHYCGVSSARPGFWACGWDRVKEVQASETKRFGQYDLWKVRDLWLGRELRPEDWQEGAAP